MYASNLTTWKPVTIIKALAHNLSITAKEKKICTFSRASSMASSLSFSLQPFFRILSQKVANNSALELPETPLLQKTSKASLSACGKNYMRMRHHLQYYGNSRMKMRYFSWRPYGRVYVPGNIVSHKLHICHAARWFSTRRPKKQE